MKPRAIRARQGRVALLRGVLVAGAAFGLPGGAVAGVLPVLAAGSGESATPAATSSPAGAVLFGLFLALATLVLFLGLWRVTSAADPVEARLRQYGGAADAPLPLSGDRQVMTRPNHKSGSLGLRRPRRCAGGPFVDGHRVRPHHRGRRRGRLSAGRVAPGHPRGLLLGGLGGYLPIWNLRRLNTRRINLHPATARYLDPHGRCPARRLWPGPVVADPRRAIAAAGRRRIRPGGAGYGLGVPVQDALQAMADRIGTNDVELVVTTIIVQHQVGGNLARPWPPLPTPSTTACASNARSAS